MGRGRNAHKRIGGAYARCERLAIAQKASVAVVDLIKAGNCRSCIRKGFGREERRGQNACGGAHVMTGLRSAQIDWMTGLSEHITNKSQRSRPPVDRSIPSETRGLARHRRMGKSASKKERL